MNFDPTNKRDYKKFKGKLAHMLVETFGVVVDDEPDDQGYRIPEGHVVMILDIEPESPPRELTNENRLLHWYNFKARFKFTVLYDQKVIRFEGTKMHLIPSTG